MDSNYLISPLTLVINTLFDLYILLVLLRFMLQAFHADFYNPISQFIVKATTPALRHLRQFIPGISGQDTAAIVLCLVLIYLKFLLLQMLDIPGIPIANTIAAIGGADRYLDLAIYAFAELLSLILSVFLIAIVSQVIVSWINPDRQNPIISLINTLASPVLRPFRQFLPSFSGLDFSPMVAVLTILVLKMLIIPPIVYLGQI